MPAGKELFKLFGLIGMQGVEKTEAQLKKIDRQTRKVQKEFERVGRRVSDVGKVLTKAFTLPLLAAGAASIKFVNDATDLNETISKTGEIFGDTAKEIEDWAETSATKIGQSKAEAMDAAGTFAIFGKSAGLAGAELVKFSTEFVELASDMASFFNTEPSEAITAIGAAFRGENEPIRRYGVLLDDATMRQKAFELGLITTTKKALMPQTKVLAAQALILEQTKTAQGDFARTSAGLANQQRILAAQWKNVSASMGQLFMPAALAAGKQLSRLIGFAERMVEAWKKLSPETRRTILGFVAIAAAIGPVTFVIGKIIVLSKVLIPLIVSLTTGVGGLRVAFAGLSKSALGITIVIGALVAVGWFWFSQWEMLSAGIKAIWAKIELTVQKGVNAVLQAVTDWALDVIDVLDKIGSAVPGLSAKLESARVGVLRFKAALFKDLGRQAALVNTLAEQAEAHGTLTDAIKDSLKQAKDALGIKDETIKKTQLEIDKEKELAEQAKKTAEQRKKFNQEITDNIARLGKDKLELLELERLKAVEEANKLGADVDAVNRLYKGKRQDIQQEEAEEREKFNQVTLDQLDQLLLTEIELLERQKEARLAEAETLGADEFAIKQLYLLREQELRDRLREEEKAKQRQALIDTLNQTSRIGNKVNSVLGQFSDNKLRRIDNEEKRQVDAINSSAMTAVQKEQAILQVQQNAENKRREMERQRAMREKLAALFNIAINTAAAVVKALPNIPLSIVVGGLGAAEAVAVAATPLPFFEGGLIEGSDKGVNAVIGEDNQDEVVFPLERGIGLLLDGLTERLNSAINPEAPAPAFAAVGAGGEGRAVHLHIGTFIGDQRGLKMLERKLDSIRIAENQRKGF